MEKEGEIQEEVERYTMECYWDTVLEEGETIPRTQAQRDRRRLEREGSERKEKNECEEEMIWDGKIKIWKYVKYSKRLKKKKEGTQPGEQDKGADEKDQIKKKVTDPATASTFSHSFEPTDCARVKVEENEKKPITTPDSNETSTYGPAPVYKRRKKNLGQSLSFLTR